MKSFYCAAIIAAAGVGVRMGSSVKKQYIHLANIPILVHTIKKFQECEFIKEIVVGINEEDYTFVLKMVKDYKLTKVTLSFGGETRQDTVFKALGEVSDDCNIVLVHDGVRPFVSRNHIEEVALAAKEHEAAILAAPARDTIKHKNGKVTTLDRNKVWMALTPQGFAKRLLVSAHNTAKQNGFIGTDDASLVEAMGQDIFLVQGNHTNIKITTPEDVEYAKMLFDWQAKHSTSTLLSSPAIIYTDGACSGNPGPGGYGAVILRNGKRKEISRGFNHTTNNRMEIMAIIHALKELGENPCDVELYSDSKYVVDAVNKSWVTTWKANNWIRANKKTALNIDLWERLLPLLEIHNIKLTWVKGHSTNIENKRSDYLAKEAVKNPNKEDDVYIIA